MSTLSMLSLYRKPAISYGNKLLMDIKKHWFVVTILQ